VPSYLPTVPATVDRGTEKDMGEPGSRTGGGRFGLLTDRKVGTKIMLAVGVVAVLSALDGTFAMNSLAAVNDQVKIGYRHQQELNTIGSLRAAVNRSWLAVDDYQLADAVDELAAAKKAIDTAAGQVTGYVTEYQAYPLGSAEAASVAALQQDWIAYEKMLADDLIPLGDSDDEAMQKVREGPLTSSKKQIRAELTKLADLTVKAGADQQAIAESRYQSTKLWVIALLVGGLLIGLALAAGVTRMIVRPLSRCVAALDRIGRGDLTVRVDVTSRDEVGQMSATLNSTATAMGGMVGKITDSSTLLASASEELSAVSAQLSASAEETSAQVGEVSDSADRVSQGVQAVSAGADEMGVSIREISNNANEAAGVAADAARAAESTNASVARLGEASSQIGTVVAMITSIAEQTNLLALNATIEAARAGEAGKGFAVVASEVKDLAQETARATQQITEQVSAIQAESSAAVTAIQEIGQVIATINDYTTTIAAAVEEQTATTGEISRSVGVAAEGSSSIAETISGVAEAARQVTEGATETQQTAGELARTAAALQETVSSYQI
jgi:methyl-accepting chemotaxis protein